MQPPHGLDPSGDASDWTRIDERLEGVCPVCDIETLVQEVRPIAKLFRAFKYVAAALPNRSTDCGFSHPPTRRRTVECKACS